MTITTGNAERRWKTGELDADKDDPLGMENGKETKINVRNILLKQETRIIVSSHGKSICIICYPNIAPFYSREVYKFGVDMDVEAEYGSGCECDVGEGTYR